MAWRGVLRVWCKLTASVICITKSLHCCMNGVIMFVCVNFVFIEPYCSRINPLPLIPARFDHCRTFRSLRPLRPPWPSSTAYKTVYKMICTQLTKAYVHMTGASNTAQEKGNMGKSQLLVIDSAACIGKIIKLSLLAVTT